MLLPCTIDWSIFVNKRESFLQKILIQWYKNFSGDFASRWRDEYILYTLRTNKYPMSNILFLPGKSFDFDGIFCCRSTDWLQVSFAHIFKSIGACFKNVTRKNVFFTLSNTLKNHIHDAKNVSSQTPAKIWL